MIAGYTIANDVSVRDWQLRAMTMTIGKSFDTHGPLGPWLVTADELGDPHALGIRTFVNDEQRQDGNTGEMVFDCFQQVSHLSEAFTLEPGDVIATGTPAGVGSAVQPFPEGLLKAGDTVRVEIDGIGELRQHAWSRSPTASSPARLAPARLRASSSITPRTISSAPIAAATIVAARRPLRAEPLAEAGDGALGPLRRERVAEQRHLQQELLDQAEAEDEQRRWRRRRRRAWPSGRARSGRRRPGKVRRTPTAKVTRGRAAAEHPFRPGLLRPGLRLLLLLALPRGARAAARSRPPPST